MSLTKQLHDLKKQKRAAVKDLHITYLHTKRDLKRSLSPDRAIRRHLGVAMGVAAAAGLILAPAPKYRAAQKTAERAGKRAQRLKSGGSMLPSWLSSLIRKHVPQLAAYLPDLGKTADAAKKGADEAAAEQEQQEHSEKEHKKEHEHFKWRPMLLELAMLVLKRVDIQKFVAQLMQNMGGGRRAAGGDHHGDGSDGPAVSVADVGTIPPPPG